MSYNTDLKSNNIDLRAILNAVNDLPDGVGGSGGGSVEIVPITIEGRPEPGATIYYLDDTMTLQQSEMQLGATYNVLKGSIVVTTYHMESLPNCTSICGVSACMAHQATG